MTASLSLTCQQPVEHAAVCRARDVFAQIADRRSRTIKD